jgi:cell division protein FtsL
MEIFDIYTVTILLAISLIIAGVAAVSLYNENVRLEELLDYESKQSNYYSKEALDNMERIFELRQKLLNAEEEIRNLTSKK